MIGKESELTLLRMYPKLKYCCGYTKTLISFTVRETEKMGKT